MSIENLIPAVLDKDAVEFESNFSDAIREKVAAALENMFAEMDFTPEQVDESVEQIDEISKKTLGSYVRKAAKSMASANGKLVANAHQGEYGDKKAMRDLNNRDDGITRATRKLAKEEVEQIDELSIDTLARYAAKAHRRGDIMQRAVNNTKSVF